MYSSNVVVCGQKLLYSGKSGFIRVEWLYSEECGGIWAKWLYSGKSGCIVTKVVFFW